MLNNSTMSDGKKKQKVVLGAIEELYGESNNDKYFLVKSRNVSDVRSEISGKLESVGLDKKRIDLYVMISQIDEDVFIKLT